MLVLHSGPAPEACGRVTASSLAAVVYPDHAYPSRLFATLVATCRARDIRIAGVLQHPAMSDGTGHACDVVLEELTTGVRTELFERRGAAAHGCRLDLRSLVEVTAQVERSLARDPQLLLLSKFGKVEAEGGGLIDPLALALEHDIPVLIGVPERNLAAWRSFAGDLATELSADSADLARWISLIL